MRDTAEWILFRGLRGAEDAGALVTLAERYGLSGNLWQAYLCHALLTHENPWSLACEGRGEPEGSLSALAARDMGRILSLFRGDAPVDVPELLDYRPAAAKSGAARVTEALRDALNAAESAADRPCTSCQPGRYLLK